jgi:ribosomal protein L19
LEVVVAAAGVEGEVQIHKNMIEEVEVVVGVGHPMYPILQEE